MKKIALFGGTGRTGKLFLEQAVQKGHPVKAMVRTPAKLDLADFILQQVEEEGYIGEMPFVSY